MKINSVYDKEFKIYGQVLVGYDYTELFQELSKFEIPEKGISYVASVPELEACKVFQDFQNRGFGGMPIQLGYCSGVNDRLNCLEYHKSSEFNIARNDVVLMLGLQYEIEDGSYDSSKVKAFYIPAGVGVELYGTTLHYAPCGHHNNKYQVVCVLPKGTNVGKAERGDCQTAESQMYAGTNKWLMAHEESDEGKGGSYVGIVGENWCLEEK